MFSTNFLLIVETISPSIDIDKSFSDNVDFDKYLSVPIKSTNT